MASTVITVILVISALVLIASILLQSGKTAGLSGSIGGGAEQLMGKNKARGYDKVFDKITKVAAIAFMLSALMLVIVQ
ncbi:preprotein translocase subunit SecG [Clostridiaceae bacterium HSG29]|nr:preprotein translocase subunit SecG [Clostridiaceae bacterium HSG29]